MFIHESTRALVRSHLVLGKEDCGAVSVPVHPSSSRGVEVWPLWRTLESVNKNTMPYCITLGTVALLKALKAQERLHDCQKIMIKLQTIETRIKKAIVKYMM